LCVSWGTKELVSHSKIGIHLTLEPKSKLSKHSQIFVLKSQKRLSVGIERCWAWGSINDEAVRHARITKMDFMATQPLLLMLSLSILVLIWQLANICTQNSKEVERGG
jgi:hypothetical protein